MSKKYEGLIILNMKGVESSVDDVINTVGNEMTEEGAKIEEVENLGRREFAYESNHVAGGIYVKFTFTAEPKDMKALNARLRINDQVHQQYYTALA